MHFLLLYVIHSAIRVATQWYQKHLGAATRVMLVTNDRENKRKAIEEGILAETSTRSVFLFVFSSFFCDGRLVIKSCFCSQLSPM